MRKPAVARGNVKERIDRIRAAAPSDKAPLDLGEVGLSRREAAAKPREPVRLRADGSGTIDRDVARGDIPFYADFFIGLGSEAELHEPEELKTAIRVKLRELLEKYS